MQIIIYDIYRMITMGIAFVPINSFNTHSQLPSEVGATLIATW